MTGYEPPFYDRVEALHTLEHLYSSGRSELFVLYGRRRVGKTELLRRFVRDKKHVYFVADLGVERDLLRSFSERTISSLGKEGLQGAFFSTWDSAFGFLAKEAQNERIVVVLDEFQYLANANPAIPSIIQRLWDEKLRFTKLFLILCGSYISFMEEQVLGAKSPLYGRRTAQLLLKPVGFPDLRDFFPHYSAVDLVNVYATLGGMPGYLRQFDPDLDFQQNVTRRILTKDSFLYDEVRFLLMQELREARVYFSILKAIAHGKTKLNEIYLESGVGDRNVLSRYVATLLELGIIEKELPVTEKHPEKSRRGIYRICDNFVRFWFRYVLPNVSLLEEGRPDVVFERKVEPDFPAFVEPIFEDVCIEVLKKANASGQLPFTFDLAGRWWEGGEEVDIVAPGPDAIAFGECKWKKSEPMGLPDLAELKRRAALVRRHAGDIGPDARQEGGQARRPKQLRDRGRGWLREYHILCSRGGFTDELRALARQDPSVLLFTPGDLLSIYCWPHGTTVARWAAGGRAGWPKL